MNFIAKHLNAFGLLLLTAFAAAAAGMYLKVPARLSKPSVVVSATRYSCPMHPDIVADQPGDCPKCGMALTFATAKAESKPTMCQQADAAGQIGEAASAHAGCNHAEETSGGGCCSKKMLPAAGAMPSGCTRNLYPPTTDNAEKPL